MKKVIVYIDGLNLYYALKQTQYKWLDLGAFADNLMKARQKKYDIIAVKYFTSIVKVKPLVAIDKLKTDDEKKEAKEVETRQRNYLNALKRHVPKLEIIKGKFSSPIRTKPAIAENGDEVDIFNIEEKQTDVNLAVTMVKDAFCQSHDCVLLVSNDSDFKGALKIVKEHTPDKKIFLFNPREGRSAKDLGEYAIEIDIKDKLQLFADSQLPETIKDTRTGKSIKKPALW